MWASAQRDGRIKWGKNRRKYVYTVSHKKRSQLSFVYNLVKY